MKFAQYWKLEEIDFDYEFKKKKGKKSVKNKDNHAHQTLRKPIFQVDFRISVSIL